MKIDGIKLHVVELPLVQPFTNRWQTFSTWRKLFIELYADGLVGWGECSSMPTPYYHYETYVTSALMINDYFSPILIGKTFDSPASLVEALSVFNGHNEAKATIEMAMWDIYAQQLGQPLFQVINGVDKPVCASASIGLLDNNKLIAKRCRDAINQGYSRVKVKIKPNHDFSFLSFIKKEFPTLEVSADANQSYDPSLIREEECSVLNNCGLAFIEQPFHENKWAEVHQLQENIDVPVCLDESVHSVTTYELMRSLAPNIRLLNLKIGRLGGLCNSLKINSLCAADHVSTYVGAKYEAGIGRWHNIALASLSNIACPSDVAGSDRYFVNDVVENPVIARNGFVSPSKEIGGGGIVDHKAMSFFRVSTVNCVKG